MIFDLHNDFPTALGREHYKDYDSGNVTAVIWTSGFDRGTAAQRVKGYTAELARLVPAAPVAIEDIGFLCDCDSADIDLSRYFYCSLTWNYNNGLAGGTLDDGTLTPAGVRMISRINGKCALDLAHLNKRSFYAALEYARRPMCSHTGFADHPRCLDDAQISALIERGAVIGLCAVTAFTGAKTAGELAREIDKFVQHYGCDDLCLGTDFNGSSDLPQDFCDYSCEGRLRGELCRLGYDTHDIDKILYGNALRFYEEIKHERHL